MWNVFVACDRQDFLRLGQAVLSSLVVLLYMGVAASAQEASQFERGMSLFRKGDFAKAADAFASVREGEQGAAKSQLYLGKSLINMNRFAEAEAALRRYVTAQPMSDDGLYLLAYTVFRQGRARDSLVLYEAAASLKSPTADDVKIVGLNYGLLGRYDLSAKFLEQALAADPDNIEARYYLGRAQFALNHFAEALQAFSEVLRRDPAHVKAQNNIGQVYEAQNNSEAAMAAYRRAIELDAHSRSPSELPLFNLGVLLSQRNETKEALVWLERAAKANPASAQVRFQLGKEFLKLGRTDEAERELVEATRLNPQDIGAHYQLGRLYQRMGQHARARQQMQISESLRLKPQGQQK